MTKSELQKLIVLIASAYPSFEPTKERIKFYEVKLSRFEAHSVFRAFDKFSDTPSVFAPVPGQLIDLIKKEDEESSVLAFDYWELIISHISAGGNYQALENKLKKDKNAPDVLKALKIVGGLHAIGKSDIHKGLPFLRKEFLATLNGSLLRSSSERWEDKGLIGGQLKLQGLDFDCDGPCRVTHSPQKALPRGK